MEFCEYCSIPYDFTNRLPLSLNCGHTYCLNCYNYFKNLTKMSYCPFCNTSEEPNCYDKNIIDSITNVYYCMWHKLPIEYFNKEKAFACRVCKEEAPDLKYSPWTGSNKAKVYEQMKTFNFESQKEKNILLIRKQLEESLENILEKKNLEIERIKKEYKEKKAEIQKQLNLLNETSRKYSENSEFLELQLNINLLCLLIREKSQKNILKQNYIEENLADNILAIDDYNKFRDQRSQWVDLWDTNIYILFKSFSKMTTNYEVCIRRNIIINKKKSILSESKPRNLFAMGLCLPIHTNGFGNYTFLSIKQLGGNDKINMLNNLNPIKVRYDKSSYVLCFSLPQEVILFEDIDYLLTYEYFGSQTYLGVVPKILINGLTFSQFNSDGHFICSESQIVYLVMTG